MTPTAQLQVRGDDTKRGASAMPRVLLALNERPDIGDLVQLLLTLGLMPFVALTFRHALRLSALRLDLLVVDRRMLAAASGGPAMWRALTDRMTVLGGQLDELPTDVKVIDAAVSSAELSLLLRETLHNCHTGVLRRGGLEIDLRYREARWRNHRLGISPLQLRLLVALAEADGAVMSKEDLAVRLFGNSSAQDERVETHVRRIRRQLARHDGGCTALLTVRGEGYRLTG